jgi:hypothetical protein
VFCKVDESKRAYFESEYRRPPISSASLRDNVLHPDYLGILGIERLNVDKLGLVNLEETIGTAEKHV